MKEFLNIEKDYSKNKMTFFLLFEIVKTIIYGSSPSGYPTLLAAVIFLGGIQLISLGVIGEYLGRVFTETKGRPPYFIREKNIQDKKDSDHA